MVPTRLLTLLIVLNALALAWFHQRAKEPLKPDEVRRITRTLQGSRSWEQRVAPNVTLTLLDGTTVKLEEAVGTRMIVLNFFATWCGPCKEEIPELNRFAQAHKDDPLLLIGVDVGEQRDVVQAFVKQLSVEFPVALDKDEDVSDHFDVESFPTTVVIGVSGRVELYESGAIDNADVSLGGLLRANRQRLAANAGISRQAYVELVQHPPATSVASDAKAGTSRTMPDETLSGRAQQIAKQMDCPCGCEGDKVAECGCSTATRIKAALKTMRLEGRSDTEIIESLNREFCVGGNPTMHET